MHLVRVIVALGAILHLAGGHWGVLQGLAWARMLVDYSAQDGLVEGTRKTFDGQHPCSMCKLIAEGKQKERKQPEERPTRQLDPTLKELVAAPRDWCARPRLHELSIPVAAQHHAWASAPRSQPPLPPPRSPQVLPV